MDRLIITSTATPTPKLTMTGPIPISTAAPTHYVRFHTHFKFFQPEEGSTNNVESPGPTMADPLLTTVIIFLCKILFLCQRWFCYFCQPYVTSNLYPVEIFCNCCIDIQYFIHINNLSSYLISYSLTYLVKVTGVHKSWAPRRRGE